MGTYKIEISSKCRLTRTQEKNITDMIVNMNPMVYEENCFSFKYNNIYLFEKLKDFSDFAQIKEIEKYYYIPTDAIVARLEELKNGN